MRSLSRQKFNNVDLTKLNSKLKGIRIKSYRNINGVNNMENQKDMIIKSTEIRNDPNKLLNRKGIMTS